MTTRGWLAAFAAIFATQCHAAIDTIIPLPKEIREVGEPVPLGGFRIAVASDERSQIGAAEINMAWNRTNIKPGDAREKTTIARAALREVHEYGWKRGILAMDADTTSIGRFPQDQHNADFNGCVLSRSHGKYFCWSRLDYHRRRAERAAKWLADCGYKGYYLHATDSGGWANPALWDDRCEECRKLYGDDHAKADATVFGIYHAAIKQRIPEAKIVAVVYPFRIGLARDAAVTGRRVCLACQPPRRDGFRFGGLA